MALACVYTYLQALGKLLEAYEHVQEVRSAAAEHLDQQADPSSVAATRANTSTVSDSAMTTTKSGCDAVPATGTTQPRTNETALQLPPASKVLDVPPTFGVRQCPGDDGTTLATHALLRINNQKTGAGETGEIPVTVFQRHGSTNEGFVFVPSSGDTEVVRASELRLITPGVVQFHDDRCQRVSIAHDTTLERLYNAPKPTRAAGGRAASRRRNQTGGVVATTKETTKITRRRRVLPAAETGSFNPSLRVGYCHGNHASVTRTGKEERSGVARPLEPINPSESACLQQRVLRLNPNGKNNCFFNSICACVVGMLGFLPLEDLPQEDSPLSKHAWPFFKLCRDLQHGMETSTMPKRRTNTAKVRGRLGAVRDFDIPIHNDGY